jgi:hypothetical protein
MMHARPPALTAPQPTSLPSRRDPVFLPGAFQYRFGQLLNKQRHPIGALNNFCDDIGGEYGIPSQLLCQRRAVAFIESIEHQTRDMGATNPHWLKLGAEGDRQ